MTTYRPIRVLMVSSPGVGHLFPLIPLAWALRSAGHDVLLATTGSGVQHASAAGLLAVDVAPGADLDRVYSRDGRPNSFSATVSAATRREAALVLFARVNRVMLEGTRQCARAWRPDVIIYGSLEAAGAIVAAEFGIPGVEHAVSPASATGVMVSALWTRVVDSDPVSAVAGIGVVPESLAPAPSPGWAMRTVPYNGGAVISDSLLSPIRRPRVLVTMGTVAPLAGGRGIVKALVEAAAEESAEVLVALGSDPAALGPLPPSVHACKWLPLTAALPGCSAVIHHGGAGTTLSALTFGVPQVVVPQGADQYLNAALVDRRGCAIQTEATPTKLRSAIRRALAGELDTASDDVRREIDRLPAPSDVASELVSLLASR